ncbi:MULTISPECIES: DUF3800 domain-containing protein [Bacteroidales]|mgnify:FL=1|uniref:DUF3800 domain-containing protein n=1 Tax=Bacteroidales TaxID=171549 RepID=UPI001EE9FFE6|nr:MULTISPECIES: DUF3800 domain-containing protein [Bacteroidales]MDD2608004.1 DUF3800 domain-containing protein [Lascolabacillus sp.]MDD4570174.1 DUF3800 domain-containing protein [Tepidanaerobacteraceae bacterium]ULB33443.1 DUF3800 domain-containing protein [Proteiniphilum propionicum]
MADTYFCFSDECGDYKPNLTDIQLRNHPFYIRTTLLMNSNEWKTLNLNFRELKKKYGLSISKEIKWANLWTLRSFQKNKKKIPERFRLQHIEQIDYHVLIDFVEESLALINLLNEKKIIATYTKNSNRYPTNEKSMISFHLQEHMQRLEMELQVDEGNLGVLFFDPIGNEKNEMFRQFYYELFENGDYIESYKFIKDSLNIENSHHSVGIQLADYISGAFSSILKASIDNDYSRGVKMFYESVYPNLRRGRNGEIQGYGIREVPRSVPTRNWLVGQMNNFKPKTG